jgi:hypothetical protein
VLPGLVGILLRPARLEQEDQQRVAVFLDMAAEAALVEARLVYAVLGAAQRLVLEQVGAVLDRFERSVPRRGERSLGET